MSDEPNKLDTKRIRWLQRYASFWGLPYPVAVFALVWGTAMGLVVVLAINFLPLPYTWAVALTLAAIGGGAMGIMLGRYLKRYPPRRQ
jgi:hypothetical protein